MRLFLVGHDYKYAVEQMMLTLFPGERPEYPDPAQRPADGEGDWAEIRLTRDGPRAAAEARLSYGGALWTGVCEAGASELSAPADRKTTDRVLQRILKLAFYRAGTAALGHEPPWGALTGVRPVKIPTRLLEQGATSGEAEAVLRDVYRVSPDRRQLAMDCARASLDAKAGLKPDEVSLYVGIPFCPTRCAYCSFVSADVGRSLKLVEPFVDCLCRELDALGTLLPRLGKQVRTVYFGGGTPTTLSASQLDRVMGELAQAIDLSRCTEYTVEAGRPDTITPEKLAVLKRGGAGRVSVNPQTMENGVLAAMGRSHTAQEILEACAQVRASGIPCLNMDLIAGLPTDTPEGFMGSLDQVLSLRPENITVHTLALKKGSRLMGDGSGPAPKLPSAEDVGAMLSYAWAALRAAGQTPYYLYRQKYMSGSFENVGWCIPGAEGLYNICMMEELHSIFSVGGGGVTKLVDPETGQIERIANPKYPQEYLSQFDKVLEKKRAEGFYAQAAHKEADHGLSTQ